MTGAHPGNEGEESAAKLAAVFTAQLRDALRDGMGVWDGNWGMKYGNVTFLMQDPETGL